MLDKVDPNKIQDVQGEFAPVPVNESAKKTERVSRARAVFRIFVRFLTIILQAVLMIAVLIAAYFITKRMIDEKPEPRKRPAFKTVYTVETIKATPSDHQPQLIAYGQTVAARTVDLRALVSGEIIRVSPKLRTGAQIAKGEALVEIDDFNYAGALAEAKANLQEAQARIGENEAQISLEESRLASAREQLTFAQSDLERAEQLKQRGNITQKEVDSRKLIVSQRKQAVELSVDTIKVQQSRVAQISASIERLKWKVVQAQRNLDSTVLLAPFDGIIRSSNAEAGRVITANDVVVSLYEADTMEVRYTLTDAQYGRLQTADEGLIDRPVKVVWTVGGNNHIYDGKIDRIGAEIASNRGGVEIYATIDRATDSVALRPGAFVEVQVPDRVFKNSFAIPDTALYQTDTVYVEVDGRLQKRQVTIDGYWGENALVTKGLEVGDEVLVTRITEVSEGLLVRREGDPVPARPQAGSGAGTDTAAGASGAANAPRTGRPDAEELAIIQRKNNLTREQWQNLPIPERRKLVRAHRTGQ